MCDKPVTKKDLSEEEVRSRFLEHDAVHLSQTKLYTDVSKSGSGLLSMRIQHIFLSYLVMHPYLRQN